MVHGFTPLSITQGSLDFLHVVAQANYIHTNWDVNMEMQRLELQMTCYNPNFHP